MVDEKLIEIFKSINKQVILLYEMMEENAKRIYRIEKKLKLTEEDLKNA